MSVKVNALDHLVINVADVARSARMVPKDPRHGGQGVRSRPGQAAADIADASATRRSMCGRAMPTRSSGSPADRDAAGSDDLCFLTASTPDQVVAHLKPCGDQRSRRARSTNRAPAARCARSIAAILIGSLI